ncbi:unnamed protein product [Dracunculus medinensis]|uniref:CAP10 domain-containing protein n=1 Tax=Dracunculus medinensis TaxID=318479 RepID=A0A0N4UAF2_DRAME|nr:unnamed protein product [Dracunculus medinensis]
MKFLVINNSICFGSLNFDLPLRYLHIQLVNQENSINLTHSIGRLNVFITNERCRFKIQLIDNFDGSYVLRIRLWESCPQLTISIQSPNGDFLCNSPFIIKKTNGNDLYPEECDCPEYNLTEWISEANCSPQMQLITDLNQWNIIDFDNMIDIAEKSWGSVEQKHTAAFCHYQIIDNELYRHCYGEHTGFRIFTDSILTSLMRKMFLPNTQFFFNLGDWPLQEKQKSNTVAFVSWCGSEDTMDIVVPTYELMNSVIDSMHSVTLDIHTARGDIHIPWTEKKNTAIFRGRDSNKLRLEIARLSNHKFVLCVDGTVAAYRFPFLLAGDSVIIKSNSHYYEYFYSMLEPNLHYIPFNKSSDLSFIIESARKQDFNKTIANMRQFVFDHLQPRDLYCYYANFIHEYTKKLKDLPTNIAKNMENISRTPNKKACRCHKIKQKTHKTNKQDEL